MVRFELFSDIDAAEDPLAKKEKGFQGGTQSYSSINNPSNEKQWSEAATTPRRRSPNIRGRASAPLAFRSPPAFSRGIKSSTPSVSSKNSSTSRQRGNAASSSALRLTCRSPDGQCMYSLVSQKYIELRNLPLPPDQNGPESQFQLPEVVSTALAVDPAIELLCVDGTQRGFKSQTQEGEQYIMLCLYTRASAFLIKIKTSDLNRCETIPESAVTEPLEKFLEHLYDATIVRIREAPQAHNTGNAVTYTPRGSFAALLEDLEANNYILVLYHHENGGTLTAPLKFAMEGSAVGERIVDFCFAESDGLTLFSTITAIFLQHSGDVHSASPIVFDGMKVQDRTVKEALSYLNASIQTSSSDSAKWRQCKAARTFFTEVFERPVNSKSKVSTVRFLSSSSSKSGAAHWPAKIQGPIYFQSSLNSSGGTSYPVAIEAFDGTECLAGFALATDGGKIDFVGVSPTTLIPRFVFEAERDSSTIDDVVFKQTALIESVDLRLKLGPVSLVKDPGAGSLLHLATCTNVYTVSTNAMLHTSKKLFGPTNDQLSTKAWTCLRISQEDDTITGVAIASDPVDGHKIVAHFASGSVASGDITRSKYAEELSGKTTSSADEGNQIVQHSNSSPLLQELRPIIDQINAGLGGMERLVGSSTNYKDITPESLAWIAQRLDRCDREITIPVQEMKQIVAASRAKLKQRVKAQHDEVRKLSSNVKDTISRLENLADMIQAAEENAAVQSQRSRHLFQISEQLVPTTTPVEREFFRHVERLALKTARLEGLVLETQRNAATSCQNLGEGLDMTSLSNEEIIPLLDRTFIGSAAAQATARDYIQRAALPKKDP